MTVRDENGVCKTCGAPPTAYHRPDCLFEPKQPRLANDDTHATTYLQSGSVLKEASELVHGDRQAAYGHPSDNHACTAALWNAYLERRGAFDEHFPGLSARDVCWLNILQKCSRDAHAPSRDNLVDTAGFAANADMVSEVADS